MFSDEIENVYDKAGARSEKLVIIIVFLFISLHNTQQRPFTLYICILWETDD